MKQRIIEDLKKLGINPGDTVLMHSSFKSLGYVEGGAETFFDAFKELLGTEGTLIVPSLSYKFVTYENPAFDINETPSCVGYLSEFFRTKVSGVKRSLHATHSCCAWGKYADEITSDHHLDSTPVGSHSPFAKLPEYNGKILMLGCGTRCNTSMHGVEETAEPPYLFNRNLSVVYTLKGNTDEITRESYRHYFIHSGENRYAQRYDRITDLLGENEISYGDVLEAECVLMDAKAVWKKGHDKLIESPFYFVDAPEI